ncbi:MAG: hypothetical protein SZ59_C0002G0391 [candidate division TM6 bacterium GW2011_GWF2_28_16]|nr:MAG: hypothetical protein SZ59_C0002G0391 [candidate division TM6 bacterium GW2011_GWF2_28_16]
MNPNKMNQENNNFNEKKSLFKTLKNIAVNAKNRLKTHLKNRFPSRIWAKGSENHKGPKI